MGRLFIFEIFLVILVLVISCSSGSNQIDKNQEQPTNYSSQDLVITEDEELSFEEQWWKERIDSAMEETSCPIITKKEYPQSYYKGKLIDAHLHIGPIPDSEPGSNLENDGVTPQLGVNSKVADTVCMLDHGDIDKGFMFFPVYEPIAPQLIEVVNRTITKYPDRFVPFIMPPDNDGSIDGSPTADSDTLNNMLEVYPGMFRGYGEIGLYARNGGAKDLPPDSKRLLDIYPVIRKNNLLVYFHLGEGHKDNFERVLSQNPDINFIFHGDQLVKYEDNNRQNLDDIDDILSRHPNAYYGVDELYGDVWLIRPEVSKEKFLEHFEDYDPLLEKDINTWKRFIEKHPDQVIWGTDRGATVLWSLDPEVSVTLSDYARAFIGKLDPSVQEKFAYKNAEKLIQS